MLIESLYAKFLNLHELQNIWEIWVYGQLTVCENTPNVSNSRHTMAVTACSPVYYDENTIAALLELWNKSTIIFQRYFSSTTVYSHLILVLCNKQQQKTTPNLTCGMSATCQRYQDSNIRILVRDCLDSIQWLSLLFGSLSWWHFSTLRLLVLMQ